MLTHEPAPRQLRRGALSILVLALTVALFTAGPADAAPNARELNWEDLIPPAGTPPPPPPSFPGQDLPGKESPAITPPPGGWVPMYPYNPVKELDGQFVKLPGYIVPLESDEGGWLDEFLLVPYYGACIHVPPPPPNQIVYVKLKKPFLLKSMEEPFWITGTMSTRPWSGDVADSDYVLSGEQVDIFEWEE